MLSSRGARRMGKHSAGGGSGLNANVVNGVDPGTGTLTTGKMKVTVCFGNVRVIVPCSNQDMLVRDLIHQATLRYKKAAGKGQDSWVVVHKLKSQSDGGILDLDDRLIDVADDREQIMAVYEEDNDGMPSLQHNAGDGTSASSVGTNSPDIFQGTEHKFQPFARTDIEITGEELNNGMSCGPGSLSNGGLTLQVRRGSEPALNRLSPVHFSPPDPSKRWSAAPVIDEDRDGTHSQNYLASSMDNHRITNSVISNTSSDNRESSVTSSATTVHYNDMNSNSNLNYSSVGVGSVQRENDANKNSNSGDGSASTSSEHYTKFLRNKSSGTVNSQINGGPSRFSRDCHRLSMQFFSDGSSKWADAADRALCLSLRKEPVGANASPVSDSSDTEQHHPNNFSSSTKDDNNMEEVILHYEAGPLGIHLVPEHNENGKNQGLIVQSVEKGGRIDRNGCLQAQDKIIEINGHNLIGVPFQQAQELFRQGLNEEKLRLQVVKHFQRQNEFSNQFSVDGGEEKENDMVHSEQKVVGDCKLATVSSTKKSPLQPLPLLTRPGTNTTTLIASNTRKIGRKYEVDLQKGLQGLGFSITTRDNPAGGNCPIYIKNILPHGAAIDDGRLRPGDRLLEVNGIEITGKTQAEAVLILKNIPQGGIVKLVVSRQERVDLSPKLPRQIPPEKVLDDLQPVPWTEKEVLVFDIPVLDTEKAGLGISVKGKTATQVQRGMIDMGIFIKSVIHGGAASRDGRVKPNDQLLSVNGVSLLNCSNTQAMETLRKTMTQDGPKPKPGFITLKVARRVPTSSAPTTDLSGCGSSASGDEMDSWGSKNISVSVDGSRNEETETVCHSRDPEINDTGPSSAISTPNRYSSPTRNFNQHTSPSDQLQLTMHTPISTGTNVINRSRSSSLRKIDVLKGKFEGYHRSSSSPIERAPIELPRNPVLDRLTGKNVPASRSDSYYRATNDVSYNGMSPQNYNPHHIPRIEHMGGSPRRNSGMIVQNVNGEMILLEDDYSAPQKPPRRSRSSTPEDSLDSRVRAATVVSQMSSPASSNVIPNDVQPPLSDVTYASQTSLEDAGGFSRDAFGRQSMSEKRHATLDAKSTDTYQRNKKVKEERERKRSSKGAEESNSHGQRLAEERNLQDQWARRGIKRPFSSSTEDELDINRTSMILQDYDHVERSPSPAHWTTQLSNKVYLTKGKRGDRLGLGDQLLQLLHHWGQKRSGFQSCIPSACNPAACVSTAAHRTDALGLPRVNSADSLVDSLKMSAPVHHDIQTGRRVKGGKKDIGPSLGMKKSSSLESLQTMVQEIVVQEDMKSGYVPPRSGPQAVRVIRGRGCNESFRQAVDRSYEAPIGGLEHQMETLAEEESESCISGPSSGRNVRIDTGENEIDDKARTGKKKQGLFRGLGSMFRFGRHRKPNAKQGMEWDGQEKGQYGPPIDQVQEQYRRLAEKRRDERDIRNIASCGTTTNMNDYSDGRHRSPSYNAGSGSMRLKKPSRKSIEAIDQDVNGNPSTHARSQSYDMYNEMTRPGSRVGFVDPKKYSHYINYDEIKQHLNDPNGKNIGLSDVQLLQMRNTVVEQRKKAILESRRHQQHYHSQRRENPKERQGRPVSNFYEYESVQAAMHSQPQNSQSHNQQGRTVPNSQQQPGQNYAMSTTVAMQQQNQRNNNGITLPSPTVPLSMGLRQISPSQFQAVPIYNQNQSSSRPISNIDGNDRRGNSESFQTHSQQQRRSQSQLQQQNSLPRRHQKVESNYNQHQSSSTLNPQSHQRHTLQPHQFPNSGRYPIGPPQSQQQISHLQHSQPQQMIYNQNQITHHQVQQPQSSSQISNSHRIHQHSNSNGVIYPPSSVNLSVGSKV